MPRNPHKRQCAALTRKGKRCSNWVEGAKDEDTHTLELCRVHQAQRCGALTAKGEPCRKRVIGGAKLCLMHGGRAHTPEGDGRQCGALSRGGVRCRSWALQGSEPPRCYMHSGGLHKPHKAARCRAMTRAGKRCRKWAVSGHSGERGRVCRTHGGGWLLPEEGDHRHCTAVLKDGRRCPSWALRGTEPALCRAHGAGPSRRRPTAADGAAGRQCTAQTLAGARCRNWSLPHTRPALCAAHAYPEANSRIRHGHYRMGQHPAALLRATLAAQAAGDDPLLAEIVMVRLKLASLLAYLDNRDLPLRERLAVIRLILKTVATINTLLRARHALAQEENQP